MIRQSVKLLTLFLFIFFTIVAAQEAKAASASVPLSITVNGNLVLTDSDNDTASGKNPTKNVSISLTPDIGATSASGSANFRIRTNNTVWRLTAQRTTTSAGGTGIADSDVKVDIAKSAGTTGNLSAGSLVAPFTAQADLSSIPTASSSDVISGTAKTSASKDGTNTNNYFQVSTTYSISPDFFFTPGTFSSTVTYSLVSP